MSKMQIKLNKRIDENRVIVGIVNGEFWANQINPTYGEVAINTWTKDFPDWLKKRVVYIKFDKSVPRMSYKEFLERNPNIKYYKEELLEEVYEIVVPRDMVQVVPEDALHGELSND